MIGGYAVLIGLYSKAWSALAESDAAAALVASGPLSISVIVPARDEARSIEACVRSVLAQKCSAPVEIIVVDDHSGDGTADIVEAIGEPAVRVVRMSEVPLRSGEVAYKKRAIETGVEQSRGDVIVTTDADCRHHAGWLESIAGAFAADEVDMVSGPVLFDYDKSIFQRFQALDFLGMIGITAASLQLGMFNLANGANLAFRKSVFLEVNGYSGIDSKASGDDMLLIYKFAMRQPSRIRFLKSPDAVVYTPPATTLDEFIQQRLRWTSKSFSYQDGRITWILAFVYLVNLLYLALPIAWLVSGDPIFALVLGVQVFTLFRADYLFLRKIAAYFDRSELLGAFLPSQFLHIVYILVIGLLGNIVPYQWKGRKLR